MRCSRSRPRASASSSPRSARRSPLPLSQRRVRLVLASNNPGKLARAGRRLFAPLGDRARRPGRARHRRGRGAAPHASSRTRWRRRAMRRARVGRRRHRRRLGPLRRRARRRAGRRLGALRARRAQRGRRSRGRFAGARTRPTTRACSSDCAASSPLGAPLRRHAGRAAPVRRSRAADRGRPLARRAARRRRAAAGGFGYDPLLFLPPRSAAPSPSSTRAPRTTLSHRAQAAERMLRAAARRLALRQPRRPAPAGAAAAMTRRCRSSPVGGAAARRRRRAARPLHASRRAHAGGVAAALALRPPALVPEEVPVLRLQLACAARRERRCAARGPLRRRADPRPRVVAAVRLGPPRAHGLHRRRHAEPVRAGFDRAPARGRSAPACRSSPAARSRSRPIRAPSSAIASAPSPRPA